MICLGVSVGPDGNICSVGTEGPGVFSLTPAGALRWQQPEACARRIVDYGEIVFGPNGVTQQLYFAANNHLRALGLDGRSVFTLAGEFGQPAIGPDGSAHLPLGAYSPGGSLLWSFPTPYPYNVFTPPDVGSDGIHYFGQNLSQLFALNPNGSQRWHTTLNGYVAGPIVDSLNTQLVMGSADPLDHAGFILSASAKDGHELWRVVLPAEDPNVFNPAIGIYGFNQFVDTRARFSDDGSTVYLVTATATMTGAVEDGNGAAVPDATVAATWMLPNGTMQKQTATTGTSGKANFSTKSGRGTCKLTVTNISKTGYTFDAANSALSQSITN